MAWLKASMLVKIRLAYTEQKINIIVVWQYKDFCFSHIKKSVWRLGLCLLPEIISNPGSFWFPALSSRALGSYLPGSLYGLMVAPATPAILFQFQAAGGRKKEKGHIFQLSQLYLKRFYQGIWLSNFHLNSVGYHYLGNRVVWYGYSANPPKMRALLLRKKRHQIGN